MPCNHRFYEILIPQQQELYYLFIGTFNPIWNADNDNNADYFYGRGTNLFWCIMPHAFKKNCLIDKSVDDWKSFCELDENRIGLTDLIKCVTNANENDQSHKKALTNGFNDKELDKTKNGKYIFNLDFNTDEIKTLISANAKTLKGVFFTRSSSQDIERIWSNWLDIEKHSNQVGKTEGRQIHTAALLTPSPRGCGSDIKKKISNWRTEIQNCR